MFGCDSRDPFAITLFINCFWKPYSSFPYLIHFPKNFLFLCSLKIWVLFQKNSEKRFQKPSSKLVFCVFWKLYKENKKQKLNQTFLCLCFFLMLFYACLAVSIHVWLLFLESVFHNHFQKLFLKTKHSSRLIHFLA